MCYNFNVKKNWKFGIINGIQSGTVYLFEHFLLYKFRVYGYTKDPFYGTKISSMIKKLLRKIVPTVMPFYVFSDITCWTRWRHEFTENIINLKLEYCFTNKLCLFWDTLHTYHLIRKVLEFIDHSSYLLTKPATYQVSTCIIMIQSFQADISVQMV